MNVAVNSCYLPCGKKTSVLVKNDPKRLHGWENLPFSTIFGPFCGLCNASVTHGKLFVTLNFMSKYGYYMHGVCIPTKKITGPNYDLVLKKLAK